MPLLLLKKRHTSSSLSYIARKNLNYSNIQPPYFPRLFEVRRRVHQRAISRTNWCPFSTACSGLVMCNNADLLNYRMQDFYINCKVLVPISSDQPSNFLHNNCAVTYMEKGWFHCQRSIMTLNSLLLLFKVMCCPMIEFNLDTETERV